MTHFDDDFGVKALGLCLAVGLSAAAVMEMSANDGTPRVNGVEHLAIFSKPATLREARLRTIRGQDADIDYEPTAAIDTKKTPLQTTLLWAERDRAYYDGPNGKFSIKVGEEAPGIGRIFAIVRKEGVWTVIYASESPRKVY